MSQALEQAATARAEPKAPKATKTITVVVSIELAESVLDAVYEQRRTLVAFWSEAGRRELARLEKERGSPFPKRAGELPRGRRPE